MSGPSDEDFALGYSFLKIKQDRVFEQKKKLKKLDKKMKTLRRFKKR